MSQYIYEYVHSNNTFPNEVICEMQILSCRAFCKTRKSSRAGTHICFFFLLFVNLHVMCNDLLAWSWYFNAVFNSFYIFVPRERGIYCFTLVHLLVCLSVCHSIGLSLTNFCQEFSAITCFNRRSLKFKHTLYLRMPYGGIYCLFNWSSTSGHMNSILFLTFKFWYNFWPQISQQLCYFKTISKSCNTMG